jgi:hypothetical protein
MLVSEGFAGYHPAKVFSCHNYPQVTPLQRILFFYYTCTCNEILILKVDTMETKKIKSMDEKLLAIVDFGKEKKLYIVDPSDIQSFLAHHSSKYLSCPPPIIFQSVLVYDPIAFQSQLNSLWTDKSMFNPSNN